jgi:hypothetical protein
MSENFADQQVSSMQAITHGITRACATFFRARAILRGAEPDIIGGTSMGAVIGARPE